MFGSQVLDVAIGIVFVYLLLSLVCTAVREGIEGLLKMRAINLERGVRELLNDPNGTGLVTAIYDHPLVFGLFKGEYDPSRLKNGRMPWGTNLPSYIPARNFAAALVDIVARGKDIEAATQADPRSASTVSFATIRASIVNLENVRMQRLLLATLDSANGNLTVVQKNLEDWFNTGMDRVSGWYRRQTQHILLVLAAIVTVAANVDSISVVSYLYKNRAAREALVARVGAPRRDSTIPEPSIRSALDSLNELALPIGWDAGAPVWKVGEARGTPQLIGQLATLVLGWLLTAFAVSLGAPFWFDVLNQVTVVRSTVKPHEKSPEEGSLDRHPSVSKSPPRGAGPTSTPWVGDGSPGVSAGVPPFQPRTWATGDPEAGEL
jgi:hypothetical protein